MGVINKEDIIAWRDGQKIICANCGTEKYFNSLAIPLTTDDFDGNAIVVCDDSNCDKPRIL